MNVPASLARLIMAGKATLHELRTVYTLNDCMDLHELMDVEEDRRIAALDPKQRQELGYIWIGD